ncbi:MAG: response regulator [Planctomycetaceae bacterium]|nr:response regulator [Planctomycetaceae bacterium]
MAEIRKPGCANGACSQTATKPELQAEGPAVFFSHLFDTSSFPERWYCGTWSTDVGWLHIISDIAIFGAYFAIPVVLLYFLLQRRDLPFPKIIWLFAAFILFCGFGHLIEAGIFWWPIYRFSGLIKACTAIVSWITVFVLIRLVPEALKLPSAALLARELQQNKERLDFALESGQIGVWEWNLKTDTLVWDQRTRKIFDTDPEMTNLCFEDFSRRLHPDDHDYVKDLIEECIKTGNPYHAHYRIIHTDGSVHYIQSQGRVVSDEEGEPEQLIGVCHDFTEKQLQENALVESELNFRSTFEQAAMGIAHVAPDGQWLRVNEGFCKIVGYQSEELLPLRIHELSHPDELETDLENMQRMLAGEIESYSIEKRYLTKQRAAVWTNMTVSLIRHQTGEPKYFIFVIENIQERKEAKEKLKAAKQTAEEANQAKSEFLANMSHELRTPLNGVIGMTELLAGTHLNQRQQEFVDACRNSGESLLNLINDILDFSKIEAGKLDLDLHDFDLEKLVFDTVSTMAWRTTEKDLELPCFVDPESRLTLKGDSYRLRQILVNLVGNAIKFTDSGEVLVRTRTVSRDQGKIRIHFSVTDTGIGISESKLNRLFQSFSQVDASTTRNYGGTGLGLVISQNLVELMGGSIGIESQEGIGSTFWFEIPFEISPSSSTSQLANTQLVNKGALIVDDNQTSRKILSDYMQEWGLKTVGTASVVEAKTAIQEACHQNQPFDIVVTDFEMPDQNGLETGRALKDSEIPVILLTSSPDTQLDPIDLQECQITLTMRKPVQRHKLLESVYHLLTSQHDEDIINTSDSKGQRQVCSQTTRILLAEDNRINQLYVTELIKQMGCHCDTALNGQEAIDAVLQNHYDLVLMDCQMPGLDGLEATRRIRELEKRGLLKNKLPIVALTANAIKGDRERCLEAGMNEYLSKPVQRDQITIVMEQFLKKNQSDDPEPHSVEILCKEKTHQPSIDSAALMKFCSGNLELISSLLDELESSGTERITQIQKSANTSDARGVAEAAHSLKGASSILCAKKLKELSSAIEQAGEAAELTEITILIEEVAEEMQRCLDDLPRLREEIYSMNSDSSE